jgi:hypothetical protein
MAADYHYFEGRQEFKVVVVVVGAIEREAKMSCCWRG